ncbi:MAG: short-chain dehydrogenase [Porticoccaceae bacterium]|nr:MAG: short-chain dehydrogenase [Porticoccaceae bacterium]
MTSRPLDFAGRVVVITGAGRGLGRAYALLLAARGARVVVDDPGVAPDGGGGDPAPAEAVVAEIRAAGGEAVACFASVADPAGGRAVVECALDHFGRLDALIHNAGIVRYAPLEAYPEEDFRAVLDVHLHGAFHVVKPAFAAMKRARFGRIVLTSSISGLYGLPGSLAYGVAKAGILGLNHVAAREGAEHGIRCNAILPAAITRLAAGVDTSGFPPMPPEEVAPVVAWLAHERCSVSGEAFIAAAGRVARALVAETPGVFRAHWTPEAVEEALPAVRDDGVLWRIHPLPDGFHEHLQRSFAMASQGGER